MMEYQVKYKFDAFSLSQSEQSYDLAIPQERYIWLLAAQELLFAFMIS